jgi:DNA-binding MarR family transcriptional regulator
MADRRSGRILCAKHSITPRQLTSEPGLTGGAITGVVGRIAAAGCIRRQHNPADRNYQAAVQATIALRGA